MLRVIVVTTAGAVPTPYILLEERCSGYAGREGAGTTCINFLEHPRKARRFSCPTDVSQAGMPCNLPVEQFLDQNRKLVIACG